MSDSDNKKNPNAEDLVARGDPSAPVDIDKIRIKILIICKNKQALESVASFLIRRGWETLVTSNLKEAFKLMASFKPDFIALSVNLPTQKLAQLPTVLMQTFKVPVITFGEGTDTRTLSLMQKIPATYKMAGSVSGPSAQRRIKQILQEIHNPEQEADRGTQDLNSADGADARVFQGPKQKKMKYTFSSDTEHEKKKGPGVFIAKGAESKSTGGYNPYDGKNKSQDSEEVEISQDALTALAEEFGGVDAETSETTNQASVIHSIAQAASEQGLLKKTNVPPVSIIQPVEANESPALSPDYIPTAEEIKKSANFEAVEFGHLLRRIARKSAVEKHAPTNAIHVYNELVIWPLSIESRKGFLVTAYSGEREDFLIFNANYESAIRDYFEKNGIVFEMVSPVHVSLEGAELLSKVDGEVFSAQVENGSGQVVVRYLKALGWTPTIEEHTIVDKTKIIADDLSVGVAAGVDIFLLLPKNQRFYRYLSDNAALSEKQKQRLKDNAVSLFINNADKAKYREVYARNKTIDLLRQPTTARKKVG